MVSFGKSMDHCYLCGLCLKGKRRRYQDGSELLDMVQTRCQVTPFAQSLLSKRKVREDDKEPLCVPCVNWKRRCWAGNLKKSEKPVLQVDQLIMFLMGPGTAPEPDNRRDFSQFFFVYVW